MLQDVKNSLEKQAFCIVFLTFSKKQKQNIDVIRRAFKPSLMLFMWYGEFSIPNKALQMNHFSADNHPAGLYQYVLS